MKWSAGPFAALATAGMGHRERPAQPGCCGATERVARLWRAMRVKAEAATAPIAGPLEFTVDLLLNSAGRHAHEARLGLAGPDGVADLEAPLPQARLDLHQGKFDAPAVHHFRPRYGCFASSSASNFKSTVRS